MTIYQTPAIWFAIIIAGVVGCIATAAVANLRAGVPFNAIAGSWKKHLWSIIFFIPVPLFLTIPYGLVIAFLWLVLAPTVSSQAYFGPKDVPFMTLNTFHAGYAVASLLSYFIIFGII